MVVLIRNNYDGDYSFESITSKKIRITWNGVYLESSTDTVA